jgi:uncharacterized protein YndB with AHSA1/START domain
MSLKDSNVVTAPIVKEIYIDASPGTVVEFLTDEEKMKRWLTDPAMRLTITACRKLRVRFKGEEIERASMTIAVNGERAQAFLSSDTILDENRWAQSSVIEIEVRPEGSGSGLKLIHTHLERS